MIMIGCVAPGYEIPPTEAYKHIEEIITPVTTLVILHFAILRKMAFSAHRRYLITGVNIRPTTP
jgi:hypothetical protein